MSVDDNIGGEGGVVLATLGSGGSCEQPHEERTLARDIDLPITAHSAKYPQAKKKLSSPQL